MAAAPLSDAEVLQAFDKLRVWSHQDTRAPNKPLLILLMLARLQRGEGRCVSFSTLESLLEKLLRNFGPPRQSYHPEYPFWRLQNDGVWEVLESERLVALRGTRKHQGDIPRWILREQNAMGALPERLAIPLQTSPVLLNEVVSRLLEAHFPHSLHHDILDAVGYRAVVVSTRLKRAGEFRDMILDIYDASCAVCGFDGALVMPSGVRQPLGIEAAHVRWHSAHGPDTPDNGLALCSLHHYMLDRGAWGLNQNLELQVSRWVVGGAGLQEWLYRFEGHPLRAPRGAFPSPARVHVDWHTREVFRTGAPGRSPAP